MTLWSVTSSFAWSDSGAQALGGRGRFEACDRAPMRGEDRARDDERKAEAEAQGERLVEQDDPKHQGNGRVDVGDDRRAHRSDLVDEGEEDEEGEQAGNKG